MRILVLSDTHGDRYLLEKAIIRQRTAEVVVHLGDGAAEFELMRPLFPDRHFCGVRGNCDFGCSLPYTDTLRLEGKTIFLTHGFVQHVKFGLYTLKQDARSAGADICLFGHTHKSMTDYEDGMYIMNPGSLHSSCTDPPSYGIVDITEGGIFTKIISPAIL